MSAIFHHAMRYEWVERNPIKLVRQSAKRERTPDVLELAELQLLLSKLTVRERTLALLDATTGLRVFSVTDISNNAFFEKVMSQLAAINCPSSRFYVQVDWICKHWPTYQYYSTCGSTEVLSRRMAAVRVPSLAQ